MSKNFKESDFSSIWETFSKLFSKITTTCHHPGLSCHQVFPVTVAFPLSLFPYFNQYSKYQPTNLVKCYLLIWHAYPLNLQWLLITLRTKLKVLITPYKPSGFSSCVFLQSANTLYVSQFAVATLGFWVFHKHSKITLASRSLHLLFLLLEQLPSPSFHSGLSYAASSVLS